MSKYRNQKTTTADGIVHDSRKEANRWCELLLMQRGGVIRDLDRQVEFLLIPTQIETYERVGKRGQALKQGSRVVEKACKYVADFVYVDCKTGKTVVEDTKGVRTEAYRIKKKLMLQIYGIKITEV